jgi:hypothetical protein
MAPCSATRPRRRGSLANCQAKPATAKAALRCPPNHRHGRTSAATAALVLSDTSPRVPLDCLLFLSVPRFAPPRLLSPGPPRAVSEHAPAPRRNQSPSHTQRPTYCALACLTRVSSGYLLALIVNSNQQIPHTQLLSTMSESGTSSIS